MRSVNLEYTSKDLSDGFTLLEVMIAVSIVGIVFVTLLGVQSRNISFAIESEFNIVASMLSSMKLAEYEAGVVTIDSSGEFEGNYKQYSWAITKEPFTSIGIEEGISSEEALHNVIVVVTQNSSGLQHTIASYALKEE